MTTPITIGTRVQWAHITKRGRAVEIDTRYGKLLAIEGDTATIARDGTGTKVKVELGKLRPASATTAVNDFVQEVFRRNREKDGKP